MKWIKRGLVYAPEGNLWWAKSHAYLPTVDVTDNYIRVYIASLDDNKFGRIGYVDLDLNDPSKIRHVSKEPVLDLGPLGTFDDSGVSPSCVVNVGRKKYLYYIGWQRTQRVPYMLFSGLAISDDRGNSFNKYFSTPILDRTPTEPFSRSAPFVCLDNGNFKAWYWSCLYWSLDASVLPYNSNEIHYNNVIKYTLSTDGINWVPTDHKIIDINPEKGEYAVGRPWVIINDNKYLMWYSIRSYNEPYHIGYAESLDELNWIRKDNEVGIQSSDSGWDSEMICFACVVDVKGKRYMFYNGNRHGETGFGYAELAEG